MAAVEVQPAHWQDVMDMDVQEGQRGPLVAIGLEPVVQAIQQGVAFSVWVRGEVVALVGVIELSERIAQAWAILSPRAAPHLLSLTRRISIFLSNMPYWRIETHIDPDFIQAPRWARMLGFEREGTLRSYTATGRDIDLYSRIREV